MARLEEAERGSEGAMREWLDRAVTAMPDPRYICAICGGESLEWRSLCPHCGNFDQLAWRTPAWIAPSQKLPGASQLPGTQTRGILARERSLQPADAASRGGVGDERASKP
jgi:HemY protein